MLTIEHCENIHVHLPNGSRTSILTEAIAAGLRAEAAGEQATAGTVQTFATLHAAPPALGELWPGQGGYYVGTMPAIGARPSYHLVMAEAENKSVKFGPYDHDVAGATDHYDGQANTKALLQDGTEHPAALWASQVTTDREPYTMAGHADYYLPAHNELMLMWICAPQLFEKNGWYWTSTQYSPYSAWVQGFEHGTSTIDYKDNEFRAVAVRRLVL